VNTPLPPEAKPVHAVAHLSTAFRNRLCKWIPDVFGAYSGLYPDEGCFAHPKAAAVVAIYDDALARLEGKTGARADAAREHIVKAHAPIAAALELVNSLQGDFGGPLGVELQSRINSTRAALVATITAKETATREGVQNALLAIEQAWADIRELDRDLASIYERLIVPPLPNLDELRNAETLTREIESLPGTRPSAVQVHGAIEQGLKADPAIARMFVAFETKPDHELVKWRARGLAERPAV